MITQIVSLVVVAPSQVPGVILVCGHRVLLVPCTEAIERVVGQGITLAPQCRIVEAPCPVVLQEPVVLERPEP